MMIIDATDREHNSFALKLARRVEGVGTTCICNVYTVELCPVALLADEQTYLFHPPNLLYRDGSQLMPPARYSARLSNLAFLAVPCRAYRSVSGVPSLSHDKDSATLCYSAQRDCVAYPKVREHRAKLVPRTLNRRTFI
jgi:hypothetical protein